MTEIQCKASASLRILHCKSRQGNPNLPVLQGYTMQTRRVVPCTKFVLLRHAQNKIIRFRQCKSSHTLRMVLLAVVQAEILLQIIYKLEQKSELFLSDGRESLIYFPSSLFLTLCKQETKEKQNSNQPTNQINHQSFDIVS